MGSSPRHNLDLWERQTAYGSRVVNTIILLQFEKHLKILSTLVFYGQMTPYCDEILVQLIIITQNTEPGESTKKATSYSFPTLGLSASIGLSL